MSTGKGNYGARGGEGKTYSSLIIFAIVANASSTFVEVFADVSMNGIDIVSANSCSTKALRPRSAPSGLSRRDERAREPRTAGGLLTLATEYSTTFFSTRSDLFPMMSFLTSSDAYRSISCSQPLTFENVSAAHR